MRVDLPARLFRAFFAQTALISLTALLGTWAAAAVIEEVLIKRALVDEAAHFWAKFDQNRRFDRPDTKNLRGYLTGPQVSDPMPEAFHGLQTGFHRFADSETFSVAHVSAHNEHTLVLSFDGVRVGKLALYFGLVPLACALALLYLGAWVAYRTTRRAVSPIVWLAEQVRQLDPANAHASRFSPENMPGSSNHEVRALSDALVRLLRRIDELVERERNFTRDASHELRSPLTVVRLAAGMLLSEQELPRAAANSVARIQRAGTEMEELVEAFLLLARESDTPSIGEAVCINDVLREEIARVQPLLAGKPITLEMVATHRVDLHTSTKALAVLIGNLLRNACAYTEKGTVRATVSDGALHIEDSGVGIPENEVPKVFQPHFRGEGPGANAPGHGVGLTIVKRFSDRFRWPLSIESRVAKGTRVLVKFPDAISEPLEPVPEPEVFTSLSQTAHEDAPYGY
ncbi:MAG: HAMP domain-containing histidine kinase [Gammaproteobacteria bacterium]|nr:HAMP domain-containing histidine kinase [Gammaproteobacteria bacterium]